jgi:hypothetical protein
MQFSRGLRGPEGTSVNGNRKLISGRQGGF